MWPLVNVWCNRLQTNPHKKIVGAFVANYFSYQSKFQSTNWSFISQLQTLNHAKIFQNVFVRMLGSMNDLKILWFSSLYQNATCNGLFIFEFMDFKMVPTHTFLGTMATHSYLASWLIIPHKQDVNVRHTL